MCIFDVCYFATHKQLEIDVFRTGDMGIVSLGEEHNTTSAIHFLEGSSQVFGRSKNSHALVALYLPILAY